MYTNEEKLEITDRIGVTEEVKQILEVQKKKQGISMAKIVCNAILEKYG